MKDKQKKEYEHPADEEFKAVLKYVGIPIAIFFISCIIIGLIGS